MLVLGIIFLVIYLFNTIRSVKYINHVKLRDKERDDLELIRANNEKRMVDLYEKAYNYSVERNN